MTGVEIVTQIVQILVSGIVGLGEGIGEGLSSLVQNIFFTTTGDTQTMSVFGIMIVVFAAISLAVGLSRLIVRWLSSIGGSRV